MISDVVKHKNLLRRFELQASARQNLSYVQARRIFNALYREACALGFLKRRISLPQDLEADLRLAKALNQLAES